MPYVASLRMHSLSLQIDQGLLEQSPTQYTVSLALRGNNTP